MDTKSKTRYTCSVCGFRSENSHDLAEHLHRHSAAHIVGSRDWWRYTFAGRAMQAMLGNAFWNEVVHRVGGEHDLSHKYAVAAIGHADALLAALEATR